MNTVVAGCGCMPTQGMLASARKSSDPLASVQMVHKAIVESGAPGCAGEVMLLESEPRASCRCYGV